jgi:hypothetical protein
MGEFIPVPLDSESTSIEKVENIKVKEEATAEIKLVINGMT